MALSIDKDTEYGVTAAYWRIVGIFVDIPRDRVTISIAAYKDDTARIANKMFLTTLQASLTQAQLEAEVPRAGSLVGACYNLLKMAPEFQGARDA